MYRVPDSVRFDQDQINYVSEPVPVHLWLDHTISSWQIMSRCGVESGWYGLWSSPVTYYIWLIAARYAVGTVNVFVIPQVKACSRETHSPSRASKTYGHSAFQVIHIHTTVINSCRAHYSTPHTLWALTALTCPPLIIIINTLILFIVSRVV